MVASAAFVICNTRPAREELAGRHAASARRLLVIPNGYDAGGITAVRRSGARPSDGLCRFIHAGSFYGPRSPMPLLNALRLMARRRPDVARRVRFCQVGPPDYEGTPLSKLSRELGIAEMVEVAGRLPHADALRRVHEGTVAVVCGHEGPGADLQIPRKFYEYVGLGKPTLVTGGTCRAVTCADYTRFSSRSC
jgi:hypothetical protein